jgi:hypothetical protein
MTLSLYHSILNTKKQSQNIMLHGETVNERAERDRQAA